MILQAFRADARHFDESESVFEKCHNYIHLRDTACFMNQNF